MIYSDKKLLITIILFLLGFFPKASAEEVLTWEDCLAEAKKNHPDLISAEESVKQSEADKKITSSQVLPQINSNLDFSTQKTSGAKSVNSYSYGVSGSQLLFDGAKTINNVKAAGENIKVARFNYRFTSSEVRMRLRTAYISLLRAQELLNLTQEIYKIRRSNLELITLRYESGMEHKGALLTAEANLAEASYEITQAMRAVEVTQRQLIKEMGRKEFSAIKVSGDFVIKNQQKEKPDFEAIVESNPSLQALITKINQAGFRLKSAYDSFYPQLSAQARAAKLGVDWPPQRDQWSLGLALSFPIFECYLRLAEVSKAESVLNQAKADERSGRDTLVLALEQDWAGLQDAIDTVGVQGKFLSAAEMRAKIAEAQYSTGFISYDNWTIIEDDLVNAKKSFLTAQTNALLAEANWIQAKGETLEYAP
jgi:outer membrane protein TolC